MARKPFDPAKSLARLQARAARLARGTTRISAIRLAQTLRKIATLRSTVQ